MSSLASSISNGIGAIPVCQRCKTRKIRCDRSGPKCSTCTKANASCVILDTATNRLYSRAQLHELELREKELCHILYDPSASNPRQFDLSRASVSSNEGHTQPMIGGFVGEGSGLHVLRDILTSPESKYNSLKILQETARPASISASAVGVHPAPSIDEAKELIDNYLERLHIYHPFVMQDDIWKAFDSFYRTSTATDQDNFLLFMIFAISSMTKFRKGLSTQHPYGYFHAAQRSLAGISLIGGAIAIQNMFLVIRFGGFYHTGISQWDMSRVIVRQCIELGYHTGSTNASTAVEEQKHRRLFWDSYFLDRFSSGILGRPFAIADEDINVDFPVDADDAYITASGVSRLSQLVIQGPSRKSTEMSVFIFSLRLRQISSTIHSEFCAIPKDSTMVIPTVAGLVRMRLSHFMKVLDEWILDAPEPVSSEALHQRWEWWTFLQQKEKLALVRRAISMIPRSENALPEMNLVEMFCQAGIQVIELYHTMMQDDVISWTRTYFQISFTAGLSVIYCLSVEVQRSQPPNETALHSLRLCRNILRSYGQHLADTITFAAIFEELTATFLGEMKQNYPPDGSSRTPGPSNRDCELSLTRRGSLKNLPDNSQAWTQFSWNLTSERAYDEDTFSSLLQDIETSAGEFAWGTWPEDDWFSSMS